MRLLDRYLGAATFKAMMFALAGLVLLLSLLAFVDQLHEVGKGDYHLLNAVAYVVLTAPSRLLQLTPLAMLIAALFTLGEMAGHSELVAMQVLGVSEYRIAWSLCKLAVVILVALFLIAELIIPPAERLAMRERAAALPVATSVGSESGLWAESKHEYLHVAQFANPQIPRDVTIYSFDASGRLRRLTRAESAVILPDGTWVLTNVARTAFTDEGPRTTHFAALRWQALLTPSQLRLVVLPPASMPPVELFRYVRQLRHAREPALSYEQELWAKLAVPVATFVMIILAVSLVLGPPRMRGARRAVLSGALIGVLFMLVEQVLGYLGLLFSLSPAFTTLAPSLLVLVLALSVFASPTTFS